MAGKAVVINSSTGTGASVSFTSSGFGTPVGAIILISNATSSNSDTDHAVETIAFWDGTNTYSRSSCDTDAYSNSTARHYVKLNGIALADGWGTVHAIGTISATTDGITITWSNSPDVNLKCTVTLFGGTGLSLHAGYHLAETDGNDSTYTGASFEAQLGLFVFGTLSTTNTVNVHAHFGIGIATNAATIAQRGIAQRSVNNLTDGTIVSYYGNYACIGVANSDTTNFLLELTSWSSSGFTLNNAETNPSDATIIFLLIAGLADFSLDDTAIPAATGDKSWDGPGFEPDYILTVQSGLTSSGYSASEDINLCIGCCDGTTSGSIAQWSDDAAATTNTGNRHNTSLLSSYQTTLAKQFAASFSSFDSAGYNWNYSEIPTGGGHIGFTLAIQFESSLTPSWAMDGVIDA